MGKRAKSVWPDGGRALAEYAARVGWSNAEFANRAELDHAAFHRFVNSQRNITRLAAIQIERATRDAFARKEVDSFLTRDQLRKPESSEAA